MLSHLNPWNTPWKLDQIHQGSVSHFKHGHQGDFQHLGSWKGRMVSTGELWIGSPFNMTDEGKFYIIYIHIKYIIFVSEEWGANSFVWRMFVVKLVRTNRIPGVQVAIGNIKRSQAIARVDYVLCQLISWYRQTFFEVQYHFAFISAACIYIYIERESTYHGYVCIYICKWYEVFLLWTVKVSFGVSTGPPPSDNCRILLTGMTQLLVLFTENPCMFMVFITKRCVISMIFLGNLRLNMCRLVVFPFSQKFITWNFQATSPSSWVNPLCSERAPLWWFPSRQP